MVWSRQKKVWSRQKGVKSTNRQKGERRIWKEGIRTRQGIGELITTASHQHNINIEASIPYWVKVQDTLNLRKQNIFFCGGGVEEYNIRKLLPNPL